ncbi:restriction endonuclease subunit S [Tissierella praeacuta]|uniref:restriction endonuclease subunit S n=1 Tax=Tissierella praeacuta TaxID=43131 RepID=UPI0028ADA2AB|nr:restriction endonuclease subunit S [Tissierella praeacuta]
MKEVREGYKMTVAGTIPQEWNIDKLKNLTEKITDGTHKTPKYTESGIPFLRVTDIQKDNIDWNNVKYISCEEHEELIKRCNPEKGDILYSKNGTIGIPKVVDWDKEFSIFVSLCLIKIKKENSKLISKYLEQYLKSDSCINQIRLRAKQGTVTNLHLEEIRELMIPLPEIKEQQKITSILSSVDEQIEITNALIEKTKEFKKGLMQKLLTKGIGHSRFKDTEIGQIPEEWEVKRLGEICEFRQGFQIPRSEQITEERVDYIRYLYITDFFSDESKLYVKDDNKFYYINKEDITVANTGNNCGKAFKGATGVLSNNMFKIFNSKDVLYTDYLWQYLNSAFYWNQLKKYFNTAGQPHVGHKNMSELKIALPSDMNEQQKIASILSSVDNQIEEHEIKKEKFQELKKGLMQKLLTGKIRVKV